MSNETRVGANFAIDTSDLKAGLAQANRLIRESESEFRAAAAGCDDWTQSEEGLSAKIKSLNSVTDIQRKKVDALQEEYDRLIANGLDPTSKAAVELRTKINNETTALNKNEAELKKQTKALEELAKESKNAGDATGDVGEKFSGLKGKGAIAVGAITAVGAACVAAVGSFLSLADSTREYRQEMAQLAQNAKDSGADLDTVKDKLAEVSATTGEADAAMEGMNMLMATGLDTSQIEIAADALAGAATRFDGLKFEGIAEGLQETLATGVAVGPFAELIERTGTDLEAFNAGLANCTTEAEKQAYTMKFLTESGLVEANAEYKEMNKDLYDAEMAQHNLNETLAELGAIAEPIMTTLKTLATDLLQSITPFVSLIGEGLKGALEGSAGASDLLAEGLSGILNASLTRITEMLPVILSAIVQIVPQIVIALLDALPQLLDVVINLATQILDMLSTFLPQIVLKVVEIVPMLIENLVSAVPQLLQAAITLLMSIVQALPTIISNLVSALPSLVNTIINAVLEAFPLLIDAAINLFMAIIDAIPVIIQALITNLPKIITTVIDGVLNAIPLVLEAAIKLLMAIIQALPVIVRELYSAMPVLYATISASLLSKIPDIIKTAIQLFMGILKAIPTIVIELVKAVPTIITAISEGLISGFDDIASIGSDLIRGLWEGISDMSGWITKKIKGFSGDVLGGIKDFFGIKSPSKLMADIVGKNLALGIGEGFEKNIGAVNDEITDAMNFGDISIGAQGGRFGLSRGSTVVNQNNYFKQAYTSQKEKYKANQQLLATMRLAKVGG